MRNTYKEHLRVERLHAGEPTALLIPRNEEMGVTGSGDGNETPVQPTEIGGGHD